MAKILTDDSLTQEEAKIVARRAGAALKGAAKSMPKAAASAAQAGNDMLDPTLASGERVVEDSGEPARTTSVRRRVYTASGKLLYDSVFYSSYRSQPEIVRVGTKAAPQKKKPPKPTTSSSTTTTTTTTKPTTPP